MEQQQHQSRQLLQQQQQQQHLRVGPGRRPASCSSCLALRLLMPLRQPISRAAGCGSQALLVMRRHLQMQQRQHLQLLLGPKVKPQQQQQQQQLAVVVVRLTAICRPRLLLLLTQLLLKPMPRLRRATSQSRQWR
jgi:hypothetical protein